MAARFPELGDKLIQFIETQPLYLVATAAADGRIELSPRGGDSLDSLETGILGEAE